MLNAERTSLNYSKKGSINIWVACRKCAPTVLLQTTGAITPYLSLNCLRNIACFVLRITQEAWLHFIIYAVSRYTFFPIKNVWYGVFYTSGIYAEKTVLLVSLEFLLSMHEFVMYDNMHIYEVCVLYERYKKKHTRTNKSFVILFKLKIIFIHSVQTQVYQYEKRLISEDLPKSVLLTLISYSH